MPLYDYMCVSCGHTEEVKQSINDDKITICPKCLKPEYERLIGKTSFELKGSGYYVTDFRDKK